MYSIYQHWDPLKVCVVGRSYPPEFYSWITVPHVRSLFEKIAIETEEDFQNIIKKLEEFGVEVLRPNLPTEPMLNGKYLSPPMTPRDFSIMVGDVFYENYSFPCHKAYQEVKDIAWPECHSQSDFESLPMWIQEECNNVHSFKFYQKSFDTCDHIFDRIRKQGNKIKSYYYNQSVLNGAHITRVGKDLYFGTENYNQDQTEYKSFVDREFIQTRNHIINTGGHSDATYCPVCPGLIISLKDVPTYKNTFPGWEVVYLPNQSWTKVKSFLDLKEKNQGRWWIPGFEHDQPVIDTVETWLQHWTGYVEETVFDVNMLIIDPKNVMVFNYNKLVFDALERYGITPHVVPFRHRYFWDGGIHCVTSDLHREGIMQDYFPNRT
jgi:glycine amidinotransferase